MEIGDGVKKLSEKISGGMNSNVHKTLKGFADGRKQKSRQQEEDLTAFVNDLDGKVANILEEFNLTHNDLSNFVKNLVKDVDSMMETIAKAHKANADSLNEKIEKGVTDRLKDFTAMVGNIQKGNADIENFVEKMLKGFTSGHSDMSEALKKNLAKYAAGIVNETKKLLDGFSDDREKMAANWLALTTAMARRSGDNAALGEQAEVPIVKEFAKEKVPEKIEIRKNAAINLEERVLEFISKHPEGIPVSYMELPLGTTRTKLDQEAKKLLEKNRVRKEGNLYFLVDNNIENEDMIGNVYSGSHTSGKG